VSARRGWLGTVIRAASAITVVCANGCSLTDFDSLSSGLAPTNTLDNAGGAANSLADAGASGAGGSGAGGSGPLLTAGSGTGDAGATSTPPGPDAGASNLLVNPGFEDGFSRWTALGSCTLTLSTDNPHTGSECLSISNRSATWQGPGYDLMGVALEGANYTVTLWMRTDGDASTISLTYKRRCVDESAVTYLPLGSGTLTGDWTELSAPLSIPNCTLGDSLIYVEGPPVGQSFYLDDTSLVTQNP
ncbi:MAG TPA: carbohydrate binding domain-containing protein, partial [Polyangiaceae bacterium]|nr:carbohydrate binding domain-containing protein [Polyangiaceae bacterium]